MAENMCPQCGAPNTIGAAECKYCGEAFAPINNNQQPYNNQNSYNQQFNGNFPPNPNNVTHVTYVNGGFMNDGVNPSWPIKSKIAAGILAIFLGFIGVHKFYLGKVGMGILYLLLSWTGIPAIIGFVEGIIYLTSSDHNFCVKNQVRVE